jgi:hypothetical protein
MRSSFFSTRRTGAVVMAAVALNTACSDRWPTDPRMPLLSVASTTEHPVVITSSSVPASCAAVKTANPAAGDGVYVIAPSASLGLQVYCGDMGGVPREYISLVHTGGSNNFSSSDSHTPLRTTHFTKIRLDPVSMRVHIGDYRYSSTAGSAPVGYGSASGCIGKTISRYANINLTGTQFGVNSAIHIGGYNAIGRINGVNYAPGAVSVSGTQVVALGAGGFCGGISPNPDFHKAVLPTMSPGFDLQLAFIGASLDITPPVVTVSGNFSHTVDQQVNVACTHADETGGSGLAATTCSGQQGAAHTFGVGSHDISASATDNAGNHTAAASIFTVYVTPAAMCALVRRFVSNSGVANSMCQQLDNGAYSAFVNHVRAQSGRSLTAANAQVLITLAASL